MAPQFSSANLTNSGTTNTKLRSDVFLFFSSFISKPNFNDHCFGELGIVVLGSGSTYPIKGAPSMCLVFGWSRILEIFYAVVRAVAIFVIDLMFSGGKWANKSRQNKSVNSELLLYPLPIKHNPDVPSFFGIYPASSGFGFPAVAPWSNPTKSASVANLVKTFIANNLLPSFHGLIIARVG